MHRIEVSKIIHDVFFKPGNFLLFHFLDTIAFFNNMISYRICKIYKKNSHLYYNLGGKIKIFVTSR